MRSRALRVGVLVILLASGAGAAYVAWDAKRIARSAATSQLESRIERLLTTIADLSDSQTAYVAPGQDAAQALARFPDLLRQLAAQTAEAGPLLKSSQGQQGLRTVADATTRLAQADAAARDSLLLGDTLTASHILFGDGRAALAGMSTVLEEVRASERARESAIQAAATSRAELVVGGVALLWLAGVLLLVPLPAARRVELETPVTEPAGVAPDTTPSRDADVSTAAQLSVPTVDVLALASVCSGIARVEDTTELASLLERAASLLAASELVVWMRSGDQLFASLVQGNDEQSKPRVPLRHEDDSPAVRAWLSSSLQLSSAGESAEGADVIAAPMVAPWGCIGVVTVTLRPQATADEATKAVVVMLAAQLSTVVAARPASDTGVAALAR